MPCPGAAARLEPLISSRGVGLSVLVVLVRSRRTPAIANLPTRYPASPIHTAWLPRSCSYSCMVGATMQYRPEMGGVAVGGVIGVLFGALVVWIIPAIWPSLPARMSFFWVTFGFCSAAGVGLVFGIYPAWKAANLDPIESLRYE